MFDWLKKKASQAARVDDCAWMSHAARVRGMRREVERLAAEKRSVVVVAPTMAAFDKLAEELSAQQPLLCRDLFERDSLRRALDAGPVIAIAMSGALPAESKPGSAPQVDILVHGRSDSRAADEAIVGFADTLGPGARVTFHLSLDDPLLQQHGAKLKPVFATLGMSEDEAVSSPVLSRALANMQAK